MPNLAEMYKRINTTHWTIPDPWSWFDIVGQQYAYYHEEDESSFQLVDTARTTRPMYGRGRGRGGFRGRYRKEDLLSTWLVLRNRKFVTIFYDSISDFWQGLVPTFDKYLFLPLASSGSSSVSGSSSGSVLDHKKQSFKKKIWKKSCLFL